MDERQEGRIPPEPVAPEPSALESGATPSRADHGGAPHPESRVPSRGPGLRAGPSGARPARRFVVELLTITAGVLIALSLEGVREWVQERRLVREAQTSILQEISENLREVESTIEGEPERRGKLDTALRLANELLETETTGVTQVDLGFAVPELSAASWDTAERTGAIGLMEYDLARAFSRVYEVQSLFTAHQDRTLERLAAAAAGLAQDPLGALPSDIEIFRQHVLNLLGDLAVEQELARVLAESYREVLEAPAGDGS
jgi:hypothetical protein